jgi:hypothetical protein
MSDVTFILEDQAAALDVWRKAYRDSGGDVDAAAQALLRWIDIQERLNRLREGGEPTGDRQLDFLRDHASLLEYDNRQLQLAADAHRENADATNEEEEAMADLLSRFQERRAMTIPGVEGVDTIGEGAARQIAVQLEGGRELVFDSAAEMMNALPEAALNARIAAVEIMAQAPGAIADAIIGNVNQLENANEMIIKILTGELDVMVTTSELKAYEAQVAAARGAAAGNPALQAILDQQQRDIDATWIAIALNAEDKGFQGAEGYSRGLDLGRFLVAQAAEGYLTENDAVWQRTIQIAGERGYNTPEQFALAMEEARHLIEEEAQEAAGAATTPMDLEDEMRTYGYNSFTGWRDGWRASYVEFLGEITEQQATIGARFRAESPPTHPKNPMRMIDKWGYRTFDAYVEGGISALRTLPDRAARALGPMVSDLGGLQVIGGGQSAMADVTAPGPIIPRGMEGRSVELLAEQNSLMRTQLAALTKMAARDPEAARTLTARGELERLRFLQEG